MAMISQQEFLQQQEAMNQRRNNKQSYGTRQFVKYFGLKNDGDEATVRFAYTSPDELYNDVVTLHNVTIDGKFRKVNCLRKFKDPVTLCPICASGKLSSSRIFIRLVEYTRDENGNVVAEPKVWDRPSYVYLNILRDYFNEYGDLSNYVFKIKRVGVHGDTNTKYNIIPANQQIYNEQLYKKDFSAFTDYKIIGGPVMNKSFDEMAELVDLDQGDQQPRQTFTPQAAQPVQDAQPATIRQGSYYAPNTNTTSYQPQDALADTQTPRRVIYQ